MRTIRSDTSVMHSGNKGGEQYWLVGKVCRVGRAYCSISPKRRICGLLILKNSEFGRGGERLVSQGDEFSMSVVG